MSSKRKLDLEREKKKGRCFIMPIYIAVFWEVCSLQLKKLKREDKRIKKQAA